MQNSNHVLGNKFDNLYFHAKTCSTSLKRSGHESPKLETCRKFDRLYFHAKFRVKSKNTKYFLAKSEVKSKTYSRIYH